MLNFEETQNAHKTKWIYVPLIITIVLFLTFAFVNKDKETNLINYIVPIVSSIGLWALILLLKLTLKIDNQGVTMKYAPFATNKNYPWNTIDTIIIEKMNIYEFGGIGIRYASKGIGYILDGKFKLKITTKDKKVIFISLRNEEDARQAILKNFLK
jgi:hypothetical protein